MALDRGPSPQDARFPIRDREQPALLMTCGCRAQAAAVEVRVAGLAHELRLEELRRQPSLAAEHAPARMRSSRPSAKELQVGGAGLVFGRSEAL